MKTYKLKAVFSETSCHISGKSDFVELVEWHNCEGYDINLDGKHISLSHAQLDTVLALYNSFRFLTEEQDDTSI